MTREERDKKLALEECELVNEKLKEGFPASHIIGDNTTKSAIRCAADQLHRNSQRFMERVGTPDRSGKWERKFGIKPNWDLEKSADIHASVIEQRKQRDLRSENKKLHEDLAAAREMRGSIAGLFSDPPVPKHISLPSRVSKEAGEIPLLNLFDLQWGEDVDLAAMGGINSYNVKIAEARLLRWLSTSIDLLTLHWKGPPPPKLYLILGGDLVSGQIHSLPVTNDRSAPEAVRDLVSLLKGIIDKLSGALTKYFRKPVPIEVISIPGNHGRIGDFPDDKRYVADSYDTLVAWMLETHFNVSGSNILVTIPPSGDAIVKIYGRNILWTHGDRIGTRGGDGGAGVAAPCARGMRKVVADYAQMGIPIYIVFMGHMHTALELEDGFVSASLVGPNERGRYRFRFKSKPASQWLLTIHPQWGVAQRWQIQVGDPSEGSIYMIPDSAYAEKAKG